MTPGGVNMNLILDQVAKEKGVERGVLVETLEQAIRTAALKTFGLDREIEAQYNEDKGVVEVFQALTVAAEVTDPVNQITVQEAQEKGIDAEPGDELLFQIFYREEDNEEARIQDERYGDILKIQTHRRAFGRIAAQTAKQVIIQRVRDAERENVFQQFRDYQGTLMTGVVRRFERGNIVVEIDRIGNNTAEAVLPVREQVPRESYRAGDRIQAFVLEVLREAKGPQIILSRASEHLLVKLFEMEVPEIYEGIVSIVRAAREPGGRAKIAVASRDAQVDPVGACVGMKGSRVQAVVQELRGEKIDIVPYDEDPARFVCAALAPAEVTRVLIDEANRAMEIDLPRRPALAGHRPQGPERAPGGEAHRVEARHQLGDPRRGDARLRRRVPGGRRRGGSRAHRGPLRPRLPPLLGHRRRQLRGARADPRGEAGDGRADAGHRPGAGHQGRGPGGRARARARGGPPARAAAPPRRAQPEGAA